MYSTASSVVEGIMLIICIIDIAIKSISADFIPIPLTLKRELRWQNDVYFIDDLGDNLYIHYLRVGGGAEIGSYSCLSKQRCSTF